MDHTAEAFGIARDGHWHCWSCDKGGDLLRLVAVGSNLDMRTDFPKVLEIAAQIAGVEDDESFGGPSSRPAPVARPALPPVPPLAERVALAKRRAAWVWNRLMRWTEVATEGRDGERRSMGDVYLRGRLVDPAAIRKLEDLRETPMRCTPQEYLKSADLKSLAYLFAIPGVALPVRHVLDGALVDIRVRRYEPRPDQPKIVGMLGGVTVGPAERGRPRELVGCYGNPHCIDPGRSRTVIVCEGAMDYLTALNLWPDAQVLGAVDAGSMGLVARHAARGLADYPGGRILIVEQNDGLGAAADRSVNEDINAASKNAIQILGPKRVGWLFCGPQLIERGGKIVREEVNIPCKDLNDLVRAGVLVQDLVRWCAEESVA